MNNNKMISLQKRTKELELIFKTSSNFLINKYIAVVFQITRFNYKRLRNNLFMTYSGYKNAMNINKIINKILIITKFLDIV